MDAAAAAESAPDTTPLMGELEGDAGLRWCWS